MHDNDSNDNINNNNDDVDETLVDLNRPISDSEVSDAIHKLKRGEAHGTDGIPAEMLIAQYNS